jgi:hypothetical protein
MKVRKIKMLRKSLSLLFVLTLLLTGCETAGQTPVLSSATQAPMAVLAEEVAAAPLVPTATHEPTAVPTGTTSPTSTATALPPASGPDVYPQGINPLTGLPAGSAGSLNAPPALVSITNFPITARPQAGLSYSPVVHELYIGEGSTRFLAMFYGDFPKEAVQQNGQSSGVVTDNAEIGPVRSGRLPYEPLRALYNGFLVMASADPSVGATLGSTNNVFGSDPNNINSAMINVTQLEKIAQTTQKQRGAVDIRGMMFDAAVPAGGKTAQSLWVPYALLDQVLWRYNTADGSYHRTQDEADGKTFKEATDRLNGQPLTYENVVVLFATHHAYAETLIDVDLLGITKMPALLFRDGKVYNIFWTTANADYERKTGKLRPIRFIDAQGNPFPMKPGQTWIHIMPTYSPVYETADSLNFLDKVETKAIPGSGNWAVRFFAPNIEARPKK